MPFGQDIAGGDGKLVIVALQSPNFIHGVQGWSINKDGSLEAHDVIIPGIGGVTATFSPTPPASPNVGDLWYNTSDGLLLSQWNGSAWVPFQIGTGAIAGNTVTPALTAVGDTVNPNPYFAGGDVSNWNSTAGVTSLTGVPTTGLAYPFAAEITCSPGAAFPGMIGTFFPANPGDPVQVNGWFQANADIQFGIQYYDDSFTFLGESITIVPAGTWQYSVITGIVIPGATQAVLFVGVNNGSAIGTEVIDATALTVLTKINGGLIETGTLAVLQYDGTPGAGNLVSSDANSAGGVDQFGNTYKPGFTVYGTGGEAIQIVPANGTVENLINFLTGSASESVPGRLFSLIDNPGAASEFLQFSIRGPTDTGRTDAALLTLLSSSADGTTFNASGALDYVTAAGVIKQMLTWGPTGIAAVGAVSAAMPGTGTPATPATAETWHNITLDAGWTAGAQAPQYQLLTIGGGTFVAVRGSATHAGVTTATDINSGHPIGAAYQPGQNRVYRPPTPGPDAAGTVQVSTGGVFAMRASGFTATQAIMDGIYSL